MKIENSYFYVSCQHLYKVVVADVALVLEVVHVGGPLALEQEGQVQDQLLLCLVLAHHDAPAEVAHLRLLLLAQRQDPRAFVPAPACLFGGDVDGLGVDQPLQLGNQIVHNQ